MNLETCTPAQPSLSPAIASITVVFHNWPLLELFLISGMEVRWGEGMQGWCVFQAVAAGAEQAQLCCQLCTARTQRSKRGRGAETLDVKSCKHQERGAGGAADVFVFLAAPQPALQQEPAGLVLR